MQVIPAIDLRDGDIVRLYQGDFDRQTIYKSRPAELAKRYEDLGVEHLHIVDLDGARCGDQSNRHIVADIVGACGLSVQLGGGIRDRQAVEDWLRAGVKRCVVGSLAVSDPQRVRNWVESFGPDRIVLALDVRMSGGIPLLATHGWTKTSSKTLWNCIEEYLSCGVRHVLCTDIERDGAMVGPNGDLYRELTSRYSELAFQASGGVRDTNDLRMLRDSGASGAISGRAILDGRITDEELGSFLRAA